VRVCKGVHAVLYVCMTCVRAHTRAVPYVQPARLADERVGLSLQIYYTRDGICGSETHLDARISIYGHIEAWLTWPCLQV
jgi:hypothetical protein